MAPEIASRPDSKPLAPSSLPLPTLFGHRRNGVRFGYCAWPHMVSTGGNWESEIKRSSATLSRYLNLPFPLQSLRTLCVRGKGKLGSCGDSFPQDDSIRSAVSLQTRES